MISDAAPSSRERQALLRARLEARREAGLYRERLILDGPQGVEVAIGGERLVSFCSNDYLGLAAHPVLQAAFQDAAGRWGVGAGASHLLTGHSRAHHDLEQALAAWVGAERALLFSTGYMANLGLIGALAGPGDTVCEDRLNHASLLDAARLAGARLRRYAHADLAGLERRLNGARGGRLVASDGVFSMDGDQAPVAALRTLADRHGAWLLIDDAHGLGVLGPEGRGTLAALALRPTGGLVLMGTLGKALGVFGAFVAGDEAVIETLIQQARTYIYTTALPPAIAAAVGAALALVRDEPWRRERLQALIAHFRAGARARGLPVLPSPTPIQPVVAGGAREANAWSVHLRACGLLVPAIRPPTVPEGGARLRVSLSALHGEAQIDRLLDGLAGAMARVPPAMGRGGLP